MKIKQGVSRIVILQDNFTLKIPKIKLNIINTIFKVINNNIKRGNHLTTLLKILKNELFFWYKKNKGNIDANLREYKLGKKHPEIVMKTRISFLGIINIQETGDILSQEEIDLIWSEMIRLASNHNNIIREGHTFSEGFNFARDKNGKIKLIDGGSRTMEETLDIEGENILKAINSL